MSAASQPPADDATPLVVDVDGTLIQGNLLLEGIARLLATAPHRALAVPWWLLRGRAFLKRKVAAAVSLGTSTLVRNPGVVAEVEAAQAAGRPVYLASGADAAAVEPLAAVVGAEGSFASDGRVNLVGRAKAAALVSAFGEGGFDYVGDERRDLPVWRRARRAIGVGLAPRLQAKAAASAQEARFLPGPGGGARAAIRALRPAHWSKNALLFIPLAAAHETALVPWLTVLGVFAAFSALVSGSYLLNDLFDLPYDRQHPQKRQRPLASGQLRLSHALALAFALIFGGALGAFALSPPAAASILLYLALTLAYTLALKRLLFLDLIALAGLFALRVLTGAVAVEVPVSAWLVAFSLFLFLALAVAKRTTALRNETVGGRAYLGEDAAALTVLGGASAFAAVVVLAFYIQSPDVAALYARPEALWLACPLLIYWLGRIVLLANRGELDEDPIIFALRDRASWLTGLGLLAVFAAALP